ncbi:hypothetical protein ACI3ER_11430 [Bacillus sp. Wb]
MYKVNVYRYAGETRKRKREAYTSGKIYYARSSKDGRKTVVNSDTFDKILYNGDFTVQSYFSKRFMMNFEEVGVLYFKNYKEFKKYIKEEE